MLLTKQRKRLLPKVMDKLVYIRYENKKAQLSLTNPRDACKKVCTVYIRAVGL